MSCSAEKMCIFLDRALAYPQFIFTIMNADQLDSNATESLMSFLSDHDVSTKGVNLHVIQRGDLIHASPWVSHRSWEKGDSSADCQSSWLPRIVDGRVIEKLLIVTSDTSGSGKTRMIRRNMRRSLQADTACQTASITIHERSTVEQLVKSLRTRFKGNKGTRALHISFSYLPRDITQYRRWVIEMNHFFFSLLVLKAVSTENFASTFSLTASRWCLYIELPSFDGQQFSLMQWLRIHIPVLATCGREVHPKQQFSIDAETRRVCTYLRARDDGTINRKYEECANKRIVVVLDCSGSMRGTPFQTAVRNAAAVFETHVGNGDVCLHSYL
jgi:hypothetical protein